MILEDKGFPSKFEDTCILCKAYYGIGDPIATAPVPYHVQRPGRMPLRFGHLACVLKARAEAGRVA